MSPVRGVAGCYILYREPRVRYPFARMIVLVSAVAP